MASGLIDSEFLGLQTIEHVMRVSRTWDSIVSLIPKGGEAVWGDLDWSLEAGHGRDEEMESYLQLSSRENNSQKCNGKSCFKVKHPPKYGRVITFGKEASELLSSHLPTFSKVQLPFIIDGNSNFLPTVVQHYIEVLSEFPWLCSCDMY